MAQYQPVYAPHPELPTPVAQLAAQYQLGEFRALYKPAFTNPWLILGCAIVVIVADIWLMLFVIAQTNFLVYLFIFIPIVTLIYTGNMLYFHNLRAYVFANGLIRGRGARLDPARWEHIVAIWQKISHNSGSTIHAYTLSCIDGRILKFGSAYANALVNISTLGATIQREVTNRFMPPTIGAYNSGQVVSFGKLNVDRQGINNGQQIVPWSQIGTIEISQNKLVVRKAGRTLIIPGIKAAEVPNLDLLFHLVAYVALQNAQPRL